VDAALFLESGPFVPFVLDPTGEEVLWVGPQAEELLGYPLSAWSEVGFWDDVVVEADRDELRSVRARSAVPGSGFSLDYRARASNGSVLWLTEVGRVVQDGDLIRIHGFLLDVSERKRREVALWKNEERVRALLRNAPDAMVITDADGRVREMNAQAVSLFQYELAEVMGSLLDPMITERFQPQFREIREGLDAESERRSLVVGRAFAIEQRDGTEIPVEIGMSLVTAPDGTVQILNSFRDLTARRRVEARVRSRDSRLRPVADGLPAMVCFVDRDERFRFVNEAYAACAIRWRVVTFVRWLGSPPTRRCHPPSRRPWAVRPAMSEGRSSILTGPFVTST
jgi:PAS domain S-box-containing protein